MQNNIFNERNNGFAVDTFSRSSIIHQTSSSSSSDGRYLIQAKPEIIIQTDASLEGWGANCMGMKTKGK